MWSKLLFSVIVYDCQSRCTGQHFVWQFWENQRASLGVVSILLIWEIILFIAIEKLIQARGETSPVLTSFDPIHSPTAKEPPDLVLPHVPSYSPIHSSTNSATSTPSSSTKRSSRRRTMLFSSSVWTVSKGPCSWHINSPFGLHTFCLV